jgi:hypothetical protein
MMWVACMKREMKLMIVSGYQLYKLYRSDRNITSQPYYRKVPEKSEKLQTPLPGSSRHLPEVRLLYAAGVDLVATICCTDEVHVVETA